MKIIHLLLFALVLLVSLPGLSQTSTGTSTKLESSEVKKKESTFSLSMGLSTSTNLSEVGGLEHSAESALSISPSFKLKNGNSISASASLTKLHDGSEELTLTNTSLGLNFKSSKITETITLSGGIISALPTSETDRLNNSFNGALGLKAAIRKSMKLLTKASGVSYSVRAAKNFHTYSQNNRLQANTSHTLSQSATWTISTSKITTLILGGSYNIGFTYLNNQRSMYGLSQTLDIELNKKVNISFIHSNGGSALSADGRDLDISFFDNRTSSLSMSLNWVL